MKLGKELESFVAEIYSALLEINGYDIKISKNVSIRGLNGIAREFDIYYEFQHLNINYKVVIECKDWNSKVDIGMVSEFWSKLGELSNVAGLMVSKNGYQSGAIDYAKSKGIMLLTKDELPSIFKLIVQYTQNRI